MTQNKDDIAGLFQPALPMRGVTKSRRRSNSIGRFQPALPMRGVTCDCMTYSNCVLFQPALPMRGVTAATVDGIARILISTRTPHAGSDAKLTRYSRAEDVFQPALPMRGVTLRLLAQVARGFQFQPALPMRGVTAHAVLIDAPLVISTRTPHAGSDFPVLFYILQAEPISTRTPHAGSDLVDRLRVQPGTVFQPALPMRGVTKRRDIRSDYPDFNPHSPCGE